MEKLKEIKLTPENFKYLKSDLKALKKTCWEAIDNKWDRGDDGFEDMISVIDQVAAILNIKI